jgi:hypothetical protein
MNTRFVVKFPWNKNQFWASQNADPEPLRPRKLVTASHIGHHANEYLYNR